MVEIKTETKLVPIQQYIVGAKTYDTLQEAQREQRRLRELADPVLRYSSSYSYKTIIDELGSLDAVGTFLIQDEGPVDFGGGGCARILKVVHGTFRNAILEAFETKGFVGYGPGQMRLVDLVEV